MRQHAYAARSVYKNDREGEGRCCATDDERLQGSLKKPSLNSNFKQLSPQ